MIRKVLKEQQNTELDCHVHIADSPLFQEITKHRNELP